MEENPGLFLEVSSIGRSIVLTTIMVPREQQRSGVGSRAMRSLCDYADETSSTISLEPSDCFGVPLRTLVSFYLRFGFGVSAPGWMRREPQTPTSSRAPAEDRSLVPSS